MNGLFSSSQKTRQSPRRDTGAVCLLDIVEPFSYDASKKPKGSVMKKIIVACVIGFLLIASVALAMDEKKGLIYQTFKLYPADDDNPYSLVYPLEVTGPGKLRVYVQTTKFEPKSKSKIKVSLLDVRAFDKLSPSLWKKWMTRINKFNALEWVAGDEIRMVVFGAIKGVKHALGKEDKPPKWFHGMSFASPGDNARIEHVIDDPERMAVEGKYVVLLQNPSDSVVEGTILIDYPGDGFEVERALWNDDPQKPELVLKDISLNRGNVVLITMVREKGWMPEALWKQTGEKAVMLKVTAGDKVFEIPLPVFDPEKKLRYGEVRYAVPDFVVTEEITVTAHLDATNQIAEGNKANNKKSVVLKPKEAAPGNPR
jgi:hypothetical protein